MVVHGLGGGPPNFRLARDLSAQTRDDRDLPKLLGHLWKTPGKCNKPEAPKPSNLTIKSNQQKITDYIESRDLKALTAPALASMSTLPRCTKEGAGASYASWHTSPPFRSCQSFFGSFASFATTRTKQKNMLPKIHLHQWSCHDFL